MTERKQIEAQARLELPQTQAAFERVRQAATKNLVNSKPNENEKREELYRLIHILNSVEAELVSATGQGSEAIEAYIESLAPKPEAATGNA